MEKPKEKDPVDIVHQNAIHVETIMKELRHQKLYTEFNINPFKKRECRASLVYSMNVSIWLNV